MKYTKIIVDASVLIEGYLSKCFENGTLIVDEILIPEIILSELDNQATNKQITGRLGLEELSRLNKYEIKYVGGKSHKFDNVNEIIRSLVYENDATLFTTDEILAKTCIAKNLPVNLVFLKNKNKILIDDFFDDKTMSVHLKEKNVPLAKKGLPGKAILFKLSDKKLTYDDLNKISVEIVEQAKYRSDSFIEMERVGSTIIQLGLYRIVITEPPFSDDYEITVVKPLKQLVLEDYKLDDKLIERIKFRAEGILVAGSPGMGKSTFVQALSNFYVEQNKIVKTVEAPRDLVLPDTITQYSVSHADPEEIHDILLLTRPDNTIFDEMRNTSDFMLFSDLRLAGVGMVGVVHATKPIDAIQRFIGRIEMGVIPQIIDTVIFIKNGMVNTVLNLKIVVKVPSGMSEKDLARPIVVVTDFNTGKLVYEIYSYGEQTVVIPVKKDEKTSQEKLAEKSIIKELKKYTLNPKVEFIGQQRIKIYVDEKDISSIIGKQGSNIEKLEKEFGLKIDVDKPTRSQKNIPYTIKQSTNNVVLVVGEKLSNMTFDVLVNDKFVMSVKSSKRGEIKIKNSKIGKLIYDAVKYGEIITLFL